MVLGPNYVFLCVPRCASNSIRDWLVEHFDGVHMEPHHGTRIPAGHAGKRIVAVVRNPYDRMLSTWNHNRKHSPEKRWRSMNAAEFARNCGKLEFGMNQAEFLKPVWPVVVVRYETLFRKDGARLLAGALRLKESVGRLPELPVRNAEPRNSYWRQDRNMTSEFINAVNEHSLTDFAMWGYEKL